jgi:hypothetical protein
MSSWLMVIVGVLIALVLACFLVYLFALQVRFDSGKLRDKKKFDN